MALGSNFSFYFSILFIRNTAVGGETTQLEGAPCTYFGGTRLSGAEGNLVNCSWYSGNACCKRTEVTSVFGSMLPLYGASTNCANQINYLMCYFCSPDQHKWYRNKVHVCGRFCDSLYEACHDAQYEGRPIAAVYTDGEDFCQGQTFEVVSSNEACFDFDPSVFSVCDGLTASVFILFGSLLVSQHLVL